MLITTKDIYKIVKDGVEDIDAICKDDIINLVGIFGLNVLIRDELIEDRGEVDAKQLYALWRE